MLSFLSGAVRIAYVDHPADAGGGKPIVLVHGFASNHAVNWVNTQWVKVLTRAGYRVIALDNRGHGQSEKLYDPEAYHANQMATDIRNLLNHLNIQRVDMMGYSMGARITAHFNLLFPDRLRATLLGGLGIHLVEGVGLPLGIADAMEVPSADQLTDPMQRMFRLFAEQTGSDLRALAACIRGSRQTLTVEEAGRIAGPVHIAVGSKDDVAGDPHQLAALIPGSVAFSIEGRDHNLAVGDRTHKQAVLDFLSALN
jgi:pimeloyl-ACP methyl ester carboxylesterase